MKTSLPKVNDLCRISRNVILSDHFFFGGWGGVGVLFSYFNRVVNWLKFRNEWMFLLLFKIQDFILTWHGSPPHSLAYKTRCGPTCTVPVKKHHHILTWSVLKTKQPRLDMPFYRNSKCKLWFIFFVFFYWSQLFAIVWLIIYQNQMPKWNMSVWKIV